MCIDFFFCDLSVASALMARSAFDWSVVRVRPLAERGLGGKIEVISADYRNATVTQTLT